MDFKLNNTELHAADTPCLVVGVFDDDTQTEIFQALDNASQGKFQSLISSRDIAQGCGKTTMLPKTPGVAAERILFVSCGKKEKFDRVAYDKACLSAGMFLKDSPVEDALICLHHTPVEALDLDWRLRQAAVAISRGNYLYTTTKKPKEDAPQPLQSASFHASDDHQPTLDHAKGLAAGYRRCKELANLPPNICTPAFLAEQAIGIANQYKGVSVEILETEQMQELGMEALLSVGKGSVNTPRLIVIRYQGTDADTKPVVMVGKGITFDTGGISLKPGENMDQMKYDMGGAASVIGAIEAVAKMQLPVNAITVVAAAENMPDGNAYRPGDVLTSMSGQTIEVLNTDAEGRLVLCDALTYSERFEPKALIDVATLTGACVIALGHHASGLMSKDEDLAEALLSAGQNAVDRAWRLPIWDDYQSQLDSPFADMKNVGGMPAGSITAGCFLSRFTEDQPWAHLDIAGSAWKWGSQEGATGRPVGLLVQYMIEQAA